MPKANSCIPGFGGGGGSGGGGGGGVGGNGNGGGNNGGRQEFLAEISTLNSLD